MNSKEDTEKFLLRRSVEVMSKDALEALDTKALLKRLRTLQRCMIEADKRDLTKDELAGVEHRILVKADPRWQPAYDEVKSILVTREHVERPGENKKKHKPKKKRSKARPKRVPKTAVEALDETNPSN